MSLDIRRELDVSRLQAENIQLKNLVTLLTESNQRLQHQITVFPLMELPKELRVIIWTAMVSAPRVIRIRKPGRRLHFVCSSPPPITLHICGESRDNTIGLFRVFCVKSDTVPRPVYFRPNLDTIFLDMNTGILEFIWQHHEVNKVQTIAMTKRALYKIISPTLLPLDIRGLILFTRLKCLVVTGRTIDPSHCCSTPELVKRSAKGSEVEGWQNWIKSCSGSEVHIQSAKIICNCAARFRSWTA